LEMACWMSATAARPRAPFARMRYCTDGNTGRSKPPADKAARQLCRTSCVRAVQHGRPCTKAPTLLRCRRTPLPCCLLLPGSPRQTLCRGRCPCPGPAAVRPVRRCVARARQPYLLQRGALLSHDGRSRSWRGQPTLQGAAGGPHVDKDPRGCHVLANNGRLLSTAASPLRALCARPPAPCRPTRTTAECPRNGGSWAPKEAS